MAEMQQELS
jgi:hypothetical protein